MIAIIDYGAGNLFSVKNSLDFLGIEAKITGDKAEIKAADRLILPGVGAFPMAMEMLNKSGLSELIKEEAAKKPLLGICLGMQLLFDSGEEFGETAGLGLISGKVVQIPDMGLLIPHMGWNKLGLNATNPYIDGFGGGEYMYFVHSFYAECDEKYVLSYCDYGVKIPALVGDGFVFGAQFHPEKSGDKGLELFKKFAEIEV